METKIASHLLYLVTTRLSQVFSHCLAFRQNELHWKTCPCKAVCIPYSAYFTAFRVTKRSARVFRWNSPALFQHGLSTFVRQLVG